MSALFYFLMSLSSPTLSRSLSHYWARNVKCHLSSWSFMSLNVSCTSHFVFSVLVHYSFLDIFSRFFLAMVILRFCPSDTSIFSEGRATLLKPKSATQLIAEPIPWHQMTIYNVNSSALPVTVFQNSISFLGTFAFCSQLSCNVGVLCDFSGVTVCARTRSSSWYSLPLNSRARE